MIDILPSLVTQSNLATYADMPEPSGRFVKIECESCNTASVVFTMAKSAINCMFCGNLLVKPGGGKAVLFGQIHSIVDDLHDASAHVQQSETKTVDLLLDTMIIHQLLNGASIHDLADTGNNPIRLVVLDRILIETEHMEKTKYDVTVEGQEMVGKLEEIGTVKKIQLDHATEPLINARELYLSKKYANDQGEELSETDCILLQMAMELDARLITQDKTLMRAWQKEKELRVLFD